MNSDNYIRLKKLTPYLGKTKPKHAKRNKQKNNNNILHN